jgi:hypothetical protein
MPDKSYYNKLYVVGFIIDVVLMHDIDIGGFRHFWHFRHLSEITNSYSESNWLFDLFDSKHQPS